jgi:DNA-directed RNA polymerase specialized sigma24 family protein
MSLYSLNPARAAEEADAAYGYECRRVARHILDRERETEACVRFALESAAEIVEYQAAVHVGLYLLRATRKAALEVFFARQDAKRGDSMFLRVMDELSGCVTLRAEPFGVNEAEASRLGGAMSAFLAKQSPEARDLFACRFFYGDPISEISDRFGLSTKQTYTRLIKLRRKLAAHLEAAGLGSVSDPETLALAVNHLDDSTLLAARRPRKRLRRLIPASVAALCVALLAVTFPFLREIINTDLSLRDRNWRDETKAEGDAEVAIKPDAKDILPIGSTVTLGGSTLTLDAVTDTTATYTVVKTDSTPLYAAVYDRMGDALASTEEEYKVDGVIIRHGTLRVYVDGSEERLTRLPTAPGTYRVVVDFTVIRNGTYPMEDYMAFYAYIGEKETAKRVIFGLEVSPAESDTVTETEP